MSGKVRLTVNGRTISAIRGQTLAEACLSAGITLPQDCRAGECGTCRVEILSGSIDDAGTAEDGTCLGCQARLEADAEIRFDPQPIVMKTGGIVAEVNELGGEIVEVVVEVNKPVPYLPGQYVKVEFAGFPARKFSPTLRLDGLREIHQLILHIRRHDEGAVSAALGRGIVPGRRVKISGPFGSAFLRRGEGRLVLVSTGTGFAPLWSIAVAARLGQPHRPLHVIASARDPRNLYMRPAVEWLAKHGVTHAVLAASGTNPMPPARHGHATAFLPTLRPDDTVHACGAPEMVEAVKRLARTAGAKCHADPFLPATDDVPVTRRIARFLGIGKDKPSPVHAQIAALEETLTRQKP